MALPQHVFVTLVLIFNLGTLFVQLNHALEGSLHGNMKKYFFKKYFHMVGNSEEARDKQFEASNIRKWIGEHSLKREVTPEFHHASLPEENGFSSQLLTPDLFSNQLQSAKTAASTLLGTTLKQLATRDELHHPSKVETGEYQLHQMMQSMSAQFGTVENYVPRDASNQEDTERLIKMIDSLTVGKSPAAGHQEITRDNILEIIEWFHKVSNMRKKVSNNIDSYPKSWQNVLNLLPDRCDEKESSKGVTLPLIGLLPDFMNLFWPFRFDINIMNQRLALYGLTKKLVTNSNETLKEEFFKELQDLQGLPVKGNRILLSFEDDDVIVGLNRSKVIVISKSYFEAGKHLFTKKEQKKISSTANKALDMIEMTHPELYRAMVQLVSCIAFYKDEEAHYMGAASLGGIWLDPSRSHEWTVPFMAEQIVHEFIHTSLQYAELVLGGYKNNTRLPEAKAMSAIRHEPRDYDKSLHAAYVSAGLITFHTRAGFLDRAAKLAETLPEAVQELNRVNAETDVLDEAGRAMLDFLTDYVCLTRM